MDFTKSQEEAMSSWFQEDDCRIKVRKPTLDDLQEVRRETSEVMAEFVHNPVLGKMERVEWLKKDEDPRAETLALGARIVLEWENVEHKGKQIKCTEKNVRMMLSESEKFLAFYAESIKALTEQIKNEYGSDEPSKNSKSMPVKK